MTSAIRTAATTANLSRTFCRRIAVGALIICCLAAIASAEETAGGGLYDYDPNNPPDVFFFPPEKARWDGTKVTIREWYMLTDIQKERFLSEYLGEMKKEYQGIFDIMGADYLRALNVFSFYTDDKSSGEPSTKVIDRLLDGQGRLWGKTTGPINVDERQGGV